MDRIQVLYISLPWALAVQLLITVLAWRRRHQFAGLEFFAFSLIFTVWTGLSVAASLFRPPAAGFIYEQRYTVGMLFGVGTLLYGWVLAGYDPRSIRRWLPWLAALPAGLFLLGLTNPLHHLVVEPVTMQSGLLFSYPTEVVHGPGNMAILYYHAVLISLATGLVGISAAVGGPRLRRQRVLFLIGVPIAVVPILLLGVRVIPRELDPTTWFVTTWVALCAVGAFTASPFELAPLARSRIVEAMQDGVILLNQEGRIVDANPASEGLLDRRADLMIGQSARESLRDVATSLSLASPEAPIPAPAGPERLSLGGHPVEAWTLPIEASPGKRYTGQLIILRDTPTARVLPIDSEAGFSGPAPVAVASRSAGGPISVCTRCKSVRDEEGNWQPAESFLEELLEAEFGRGICYSCTEELYPDYAKHLRRDWDDPDSG